MKKWILWLLVLLILTVLAVYIIIPSKIVISKIVPSPVSSLAEFRYIGHPEYWEKWWRDAQGKPHRQGEPFSYDGTTFRLHQTGYNVAGIEIEQGGEVLLSQLDLIPLKWDSTLTRWTCELAAGNDPFTRMRQFRKAAKLSKKMQLVLANLNQFFSDPLNVYGISISRTTFWDTCMLSTRFTTTAYPTTAELYGYFDMLKKNVLQQKAQVAGYPMMNVRMLKADSFETQVAIPTSRFLQSEGKTFSRKMVPGNFLTTVVRGGRFSVAEALQQMEYYMKDYNKSQMASPFQQLITDRTTESDTSKWITRIYLPIAK